MRTNKTGDKERRNRRSGSRRRKSEVGEYDSLDSNHPAAWRAYRISVWSIVPGFGLVLGPLAMILGARAVRAAGDDLSASNRSKTAILFGAASALTQWWGVILLYQGWGG